MVSLLVKSWESNTATPKFDGHKMLSSCLASRTSSRRSRVQQRQLFDFTNTTACDNDDSSRPSRYQRASPNNPYNEEIERLQNELDEPCDTCFYTGVVVCTGLSLYFAKLAIEDGLGIKNQRFLLACSAGWVLAGAYRWHLGWWFDDLRWIHPSWSIISGEETAASTWKLVETLALRQFGGLLLSSRGQSNINPYFLPYGCCCTKYVEISSHFGSFSSFNQNYSKENRNKELMVLPLF